MAEKKKIPFTPRPKPNKHAAALLPTSAAAPTSPVGLEVDERPTIHMPAPPALPAPVPHDVIARRANEIHHARGGSAFDNWIQAEQELAAR